MALGVPLPLPPSPQRGGPGATPGQGFGGTPQAYGDGSYGQGFGVYTNKANPTIGTDANPYRSVFDRANAYYTPEIAKIQLGRQQSTAQTDALYGAKNRGLQSDYDLGMRGTALDEQGLSVQRGAANRDNAYYGNLLGLLPQYRGYNTRERDAAIQDAQRSSRMEQIGTNSEYTARGGWLTPMRGVKNADSVQREGLATERANIGFGRDELGLTEKQWGLERSQAQTGDTLRNLDIESARLGLTREKYKAALEQGLAQLGYDKFMSTEDLMSKFDGQQSDLARQISEQAVGIGNALNTGAVGNSYGQYFGG